MSKQLKSRAEWRRSGQALQLNWAVLDPDLNWISSAFTRNIERFVLNHRPKQ
jgi:hypothetical protein